MDETDNRKPEGAPAPTVRLRVEDVIPPLEERGLTVTGRLLAGRIAVGDALWLHGEGVRHRVTVRVFERLRECFGPPAGGGTGVVLRLAGVTEDEVSPGMMLGSEP